MSITAEPQPEGEAPAAAGAPDAEPVQPDVEQSEAEPEPVRPEPHERSSGVPAAPRGRTGGGEPDGSTEPGSRLPGTHEADTHEASASAGADDAGADDAGAEKPGAEQPGAEQPGAEQPQGEHRGVEQPGLQAPSLRPLGRSPEPADADATADAGAPDDAGAITDADEPADAGGSVPERPAGAASVDDDPFADLVLDESFVAAATAKEESGRTRMLAARWEGQPPEPTPWRAAPEPRRRLLRRRPPRLDAFGQPVRRRFRAGPWQVLIAVVLVLAALNPGAVRRMLAAAGKAPGTVPTAAPTVTFTEPTPSAAASPSDDPGIPSTSRPFAGSPAADWASGADGIVLPAAKAYGNVSTARVAASLRRVKRFLVETNLDPAVIGGGTPNAALALIDPEERDPQGVSLADQLRRALAHPSDTDDPVSVFSRFDPRQALLDGTTVKVKGTMVLGTDGRGGTMITVDYTFVYALRSSTRPDAEVTRTIVRRMEKFDVLDTARYVVTPGTVMLRDYRSYDANGGCGASHGYLVPEFPGQEPASGPTPSGTPVDPYDRSKPIDDTPGCGTVSRT